MSWGQRWPEVRRVLLASAMGLFAGLAVAAMRTADQTERLQTKAGTTAAAPTGWQQADASDDISDDGRAGKQPPDSGARQSPSAQSEVARLEERNRRLEALVAVLQEQVAAARKEAARRAVRHAAEEGKVLAGR